MVMCLMVNGQSSKVQGYGSENQYMRVSIPRALVEHLGISIGDVLMWSIRDENSLILHKVKIDE